MSVRRTVGSTTVGHVVRSCEASCHHQSTHVKELTCTNKIRKVKARIVEKGRDQHKAWDQKRITRTSTVVV